MIRIVRLYRTVLPVEQQRLARVQEIFRQRFPAVADYAEKIPDQLNNPFKYGHSTVLLLSESRLTEVTGFLIFFLFHNIKSALLDFLAVKPGIQGAGTGGALYEAARQYLKREKSLALYMEVAPDDPSVIKDPEELKENIRRLRFYENYSALPVIGTEYETPIDDSPAPYLLVDKLDRTEPLRRSQCRAAVRTILTHKYGRIVKPEYIEHVVKSFIDDPVRFRQPMYTKPNSANSQPKFPQRLQEAFAVVLSQKHIIHHVRDRGYVERPARVKAIANSLESTGLFQQVAPRSFSKENILQVHDHDFVRYLKDVCLKLNSPGPVYPYVFPIRRPERRPKDLSVRAGYYCIDTFTPLDKNAFDAAIESVNVALTAAEQVIRARPLAYALCRPPGHHAEKRVFGGFCYFNNAAIAANFLSKHGKVAIIDIYFHHGNGTQDIFYSRDDVLTISIHGHPNFAYPYFSGFADEKGDGKGLSFNHNFPLAENAGSEVYMKKLQTAVDHIRTFAPMFLVVSLGFDIMKQDPTGSFGLNAEDIRRIAFRLASLNLPTLIVQEGGYNLRNLKAGSVAFFTGFAQALTRPTIQKNQKNQSRKL